MADARQSDSPGSTCPRRTEDGRQEGGGRLAVCLDKDHGLSRGLMRFLLSTDAICAIPRRRERRRRTFDLVKRGFVRAQITADVDFRQDQRLKHSHSGSQDFDVRFLTFGMTDFFFPQQSFRATSRRRLIDYARRSNPACYPNFRILLCTFCEQKMKVLKSN